MFTPEEATQAVMQFLKARPAPPPGEERESWIDDEIAAPVHQSIELSKVDYNVGVEDDDVPLRPFSFTMIQSEEQAYAWYKTRHPQYPDDVIRVMAQGWRPTQEVQTSPTRMPKKEVEFSVEQGEVEVEFN